MTFIDMRPEELRWKGDPYWIDVRKAGEFLGLADKTVLHAGPPIEYERMCLGHQRSMVNACFFEGWAKTEEEAVRMLKSGEVKVEAKFLIAHQISALRNKLLRGLPRNSCNYVRLQHYRNQVSICTANIWSPPESFPAATSIKASQPQLESCHLGPHICVFKKHLAAPSLSCSMWDLVP